VQAIHSRLYAVLAVAERALEPYTGPLLWLEGRRQSLRVKELRSQSDQVLETPIAPARGCSGRSPNAARATGVANLKPTRVAGLLPPQGAHHDLAGVPSRGQQPSRRAHRPTAVNGRGFDESDLAGDDTSSRRDRCGRCRWSGSFAEMESRESTKGALLPGEAVISTTARAIDQVAEVAIRRTPGGREVEAFAGRWSWRRRRGRSSSSPSLHVQDHRGPRGSSPGFPAEDGLVERRSRRRHPLPHGTARTPAPVPVRTRRRRAIDGIKVLPLLWKDLASAALVLGQARSPSSSPIDLLDMLESS